MQGGDAENDSALSPLPRFVHGFAGLSWTLYRLLCGIQKVAGDNAHAGNYRHHSFPSQDSGTGLSDLHDLCSRLLRLDLLCQDAVLTDSCQPIREVTIHASLCRGNRPCYSLLWGPNTTEINPCIASAGLGSRQIP